MLEIKYCISRRNFDPEIEAARDSFYTQRKVQIISNTLNEDKRMQFEEHSRDCEYVHRYLFRKQTNAKHRYTNT